jgi:hypothetical protein
MDENERELITKLGTLVTQRFGAGQWHAAFENFDHDRDGKINGEELSALLESADVGNVFTRNVWATEVLKRVDHDRDGLISFAELNAIVSPLVPVRVLPEPTPVRAPARAPTPPKSSGNEVLVGLGLAFVGYRVFLRGRR